MSKVLVIGDVHLDKSKNLGKSLINSNLNSRVFDQMEILDWTLEEAETNFVTDIVLSGDVFEDPDAKHEVINLFINWLKKCKHYEIDVHIIRGNHDYKRIENKYFSPLDILKTLELDNVFVYYDFETIKIDNTAITFMPFLDRKSLFKDSLEDAKNYVKTLISYQRSLIDKNLKSIAIGHLALEGSMYVGDEIDDISNEIIIPLDYFKGYDYVWMGHVHKYQILSKTPYISHIGSMDISDFGECDEKKYIIIYDCIENKFEAKEIPTKKLQKIKIVIENENDSVEEKLKEYDFKNKIISVEIEYKNETKIFGKSKVKEILNKGNPYVIANISESKEVKLKENEKTKTFKISSSIDSAISDYCNKFIKEDLKEKFMEKAKLLMKEVK